MRLLILVSLTSLVYSGEAQQDTSLPPAVLARNGRSSRLPPPEVQRGERVSVTVSCGTIQLKFNAETESSGHIGESVIVRNPENGRRFVARVEQKGRVTVKK